VPEKKEEAKVEETKDAKIEEKKEDKTEAPTAGVEIQMAE
tara:strand:+ start:234 stop:353 length:120 start_codon:yes stop_codon:yes gene_type:complete